MHSKAQMKSGFFFVCINTLVCQLADKLLLDLWSRYASLQRHQLNLSICPGGLTVYVFHRHFLLKAPYNMQGTCANQILYRKIDYSFEH